MNQPEDILNMGGLENLPDYTSFKRKTPSVKRYPSNSKRKLTKWYISFVKNNNPKIGYKYWISVNGYLENNSLIQSSPIIDIESPLVILTENTKYYLVDKSDVLKFPPHSRFELKELAKFTNGFPQDWKNIIVAQLSEIFGVCRIKPIKLTENILSPFDKVLKELFPEENTVIEDNYELPIIKKKIESITGNENKNRKIETCNTENSEYFTTKNNFHDTKNFDDSLAENLNILKEQIRNDTNVKKLNNITKKTTDNDSDNIEIKYKNIKNDSFTQLEPADIFLEENINDFFNDKYEKNETSQNSIEKEKLEFPTELLESRSDMKYSDDIKNNKNKDSFGIPSDLLNISDKLLNAENNSFERVMNLIYSQKNNKKSPKIKETKLSERTNSVERTRFDDQSILEDRSFDILLKKTKEFSEKDSKNNTTKKDLSYSEESHKNLLIKEDVTKSLLTKSQFDNQSLMKSSSFKEEFTKSASVEELLTKTSSESLQKTLLSDELDNSNKSSEDTTCDKSKISVNPSNEILNSSANKSKELKNEINKNKLEDQTIKDRSEIIDYFINSSFNFNDKNNMTNFDKLNEDMTIDNKIKNIAEESRGDEKSKIIDSIYNMGNVFYKTQGNSTFKPNDTDKINISIINKRKNSQTPKKKNSLGGTVKSTNSFLSCDKTSQKDNENKSMLETMMNGKITKPYSFEDVKSKNKFDTPVKKKNKLTKNEEDNQNSINLISANESLSKEIENIKKKYFREEIEKEEEASDSSEVEVKSLVKYSKIKTPTQAQKKKKKGRTSLCMPKKKSSTKSKTDETF